MNTAPECDKVLLVQAELDGELDAAEAAARSRRIGRIARSVRPPPPNWRTPAR